MFSLLPITEFPRKVFLNIQHHFSILASRKEMLAVSDLIFPPHSHPLLGLSISASGGGKMKQANEYGYWIKCFRNKINIQGGRKMKLSMTVLWFLWLLFSFKSSRKNDSPLLIYEPLLCLAHLCGRIRIM